MFLTRIRPSGERNLQTKEALMTLAEELSAYQATLKTKLQECARALDDFRKAAPDCPTLPHLSAMLQELEQFRSFHVDTSLADFKEALEPSPSHLSAKHMKRFFELGKRLLPATNESTAYFASQAQQLQELQADVRSFATDARKYYHENPEALEACDRLGSFGAQALDRSALALIQQFQATIEKPAPLLR